MKDQPTFFDFAAEVGLTKHFGGITATEALISKTYAIDVQDEAKGILRRYGWGGMLQVMGRMLLLYAKNPSYRNFVKRVRRGGVVPDHLNEYFGYGLFVGQKK